jgi:predicted transcriptional regulator
MARPKTKELTERELEVMHALWDRGEGTIAELRDDLAKSGRELAYTTVATLVKILLEKCFIEQMNDERPFRYQAARTFEDVSHNIVGDLVDRVFGGAREQLLVRLFDRGKLTDSERRVLEQILAEQKKR